MTWYIYVVYIYKCLLCVCLTFFSFASHCVINVCLVCRPRRLMSARRRGIMERIIGFPITAARYSSLLAPFLTTSVLRSSKPSCPGSKLPCPGSKPLLFCYHPRFVAAHYVARRLIYPGSLAVYNLAVGMSIYILS